jgi:hypothetical protein
MIGGQPRSSLAALDNKTGLATGWNPLPDKDINAIAVSGSTVFVGGKFSNIGGQTRWYMAGVDAQSGLATNWKPDANAQVNALQISGDIVYAGGEFALISGVTRASLVAVAASSGMPTEWRCDAQGSVSTLASFGSRVYAGGPFTQISRSPNAYIAGISTAFTSFAATEDLVPRETRLEQNYPNPFNPTTNFEFRVSDFEFVSLKVFDVLGKEVATLVNEVRPSGTYTVRWDGSRLPSGVYFYRLRMGGFTETKKMLLAK